MQSKLSWHTLLFRVSASYSKILNIKSIFKSNTYSENFQDNSRLTMLVKN